MPLYDYHCPYCGHQKEVVKKLAALDEPVVCDTHGCTVKMERVIGAPPGFILRGVGFHQNDYGKEYGGR